MVRPCAKWRGRRHAVGDATSLLRRSCSRLMVGSDDGAQSHPGEGEQAAWTCQKTCEIRVIETNKLTSKKKEEANLRSGELSNHLLLSLELSLASRGGYMLIGSHSGT